MPKKNDDQYSDEEAKARMKVALLGARIAGHKPMESLTKKKPKVRKAGEKSKTKKSAARSL